MLSHIALLIVIASAKNNRSSQIFNTGDIVFVCDKLLIENSEENITVTYASIIDSEEFIHFGVECVEYDSVTGTSIVKIEIIILYNSQSMRFKYLDASGINIKIRNTYLISGFIKFSDSGKLMIEATDFDFLKSQIYSSNITKISSDKSSKSHSILDIIADNNKPATSNNHCSINRNNNTTKNHDNREQHSDYKEERVMSSDEHIKSMDKNNDQEDKDQSKKRKRSMQSFSIKKKKGKKAVK
ncbi:6201_t:CDS:2 [Dentiscutata erythropus]|uniref:6201_t:CDS:1 n=1 Tax=Dentiscutata erythropus TaxID=1348616 RepID=A0A9N8Z5S9_9GLOM|nr:6201_t:CDS:2 [Dentiscutata erythropus]